MPTLADLQRLRDQQSQPDPGIKIDAPPPPEKAMSGPTLSDLQALRDKNKPKAAPTPPADKGPGIGKKAAGVLAAPGFALMQTAGEIGEHPIKGTANIVKDAAVGGWQGAKQGWEDLKKAGHAGAKAVSPDLSALHRAKLAGYGLFKGAQAVADVPMGVLENTYGKRASEGSAMVNDGKPLISPSSASILPSMMVGGKKKIAEEAKTFAGAAQRFGMDFSKAKEPSDIAVEVGRATKENVQKLANLIWDRSPKTADINKPGEVASNAIKNFQSRKGEESALWSQSENMGNKIPVDVKPHVEQLQDLRKAVAARIASGEDTPDVKKAQALIDRVLGELGSPTQPEQQIIEKTKEVGGITKTTQRERQFPQDAGQTTVKEVEPTTQMGGKKFSETSQTPVETNTNVNDKTRTTTQSPYTVTQRTVKGEAPKPARAATAGDIVRARRAANDGLYHTADRGVTGEVKDVLNGALSDVGKKEKSFANVHQKALQKTQSNADIYRDDAKAAKFGFDEETLNALGAKMRQGREIPTAVLEKINAGVDQIKTPEDLLFLKRTLDKQQFSMAMRAKAAAILDEAGTDIKKVVGERPMLEKIYELSGFPKEKYTQQLDDLQAVAREMDHYNIPSMPQVGPGVEKAKSRMQSLVKALTLGMAYSNPKQMFYHLGQAVAPADTNAELALKALKGRANPKAPTNIPGAAIGGVLSGTDKQQ
jgi:hypothetical protein